MQLAFGLLGNAHAIKCRDSRSAACAALGMCNSKTTGAYGYLLDAKGAKLTKHDKDKKSLQKEFVKWRRMEFVFELVNDPTMGGLIDDVEPLSLNKAYQIVADKEGVSHSTVKRAYEKLKAEIGEEKLGEYINRKVSELWHQSIAGK